MLVSARVTSLVRSLLIAVPCMGSVAVAGLAHNANAFPFVRKKAPVVAVAPAPAPAPTPLRAAMSAEIQSPGLAPTPPSGAAAAPAQASAIPEVPATAAERLTARSLDLVGQSRFWLDELRKRPTDTEAAYEASVALRAIGSPDRAVQTAAMGIQTNPNEPRLWSALALGLVGDNQDEAALQALQKAISLNPRDARLQSSLGVVYDRLESPVMAATAYQAALILAPGDSAILSNYGLSVAMAGDLPRAEVLLRQAVQNPLSPPQARQNLALVVGLQGRFSESEQLASRDLPAAIATENVAYLRRMLNGGDSRWSQAASAGN
jgi:Flp pilus assembly protein TadD